MRALLLCAIVAVCAAGTDGARRRLIGGVRRPFQRRPLPFGHRQFQFQEQPLRDASQERLGHGPQPQLGQGPQPQLRRPSQQQFRLSPDTPFRLALQKEPVRGESQDQPLQVQQEPARLESEEKPLQVQEGPVRRVLQEEPLQDAPQSQAATAATSDNWSYRGPAAQQRQDFTPQLAQAKRTEFSPSFSEPEVMADERQDQYSLTIPEKTDKNRLEFQLHGQQGPHSYKFGYDTGSGYNRQFRFEESDGHGNLKGRYGFYDQSGKLQVVNYSSTHEGGFHAEGDFGAFPIKER